MNPLASYLMKSGVLTTDTLIRAFRKIDRKDFVPSSYLNEAYGDYPIPISDDGQTISQPTTVAIMLELLGAQKGDKVLDVGSGSGFTTALLADMVGHTGQVIGVEIVPQLVTFGQTNLRKYHLPHATIREAVGVLGMPSEAPFDRILVSASAKELPQSLVLQLKPGGVMVISVGNELWRVEKSLQGGVSIKKYPGFVFVPLIELN